MTDLPLFDYARKLRDAGVTQAAAHAPKWSEIAYRAIRAIAWRQPHVHVDDVLAAGVPDPPHPNAWGSVWARCLREGMIQRCNQTKPCTLDPKKHAHQYPVYFSRIYRS